MSEEIELQVAVDRLVSEFKKDQTEGSYFYGWQANIAMAFYDECKDAGSDMDNKALAELCNAAAKRFLVNFCVTT